MVRVQSLSTVDLHLCSAQRALVAADAALCLLLESEEDSPVSKTPDVGLDAEKKQPSQGVGPHAHSANNFKGLHVGYVLLASVLLGLSLGYGIDLWLDSLPWGMLAGSLFFIAAGLYQVVKEFTQ